jgi:hypothetical protein
MDTNPEMTHTVVRVYKNEESTAAAIDSLDSLPTSHPTSQRLPTGLYDIRIMEGRDYGK